MIKRLLLPPTQCIVNYISVLVRLTVERHTHALVYNKPYTHRLQVSRRTL